MNAAKQIIDAAQAAGTLKQYRKVGVVVARAAHPGERIDTIIDGVRETTNRAAAGDVVVTGARGEQYILAGDKFRARYRERGRNRDGDREYAPTGTCWAVVYTGPSFEFMAPWNERMRIDPGDYMCTTEIGSNDVYRIERGVFHTTYAPI